eukprot:scaffold34268_cov43-Cyclotella_meneghiniana.AAC.5
MCRSMLYHDPSGVSSGKAIPPSSTGALSTTLLIFRLIPSFGKKASSITVLSFPNCRVVNLVRANGYVIAANTHTLIVIHASLIWKLVFGWPWGKAAIQGHHWVYRDAYMQSWMLFLGDL